VGLNHRPADYELSSAPFNSDYITPSCKPQILHGGVIILCFTPILLFGCGSKTRPEFAVSFVGTASDFAQDAGMSPADLNANDIVVHHFGSMTDRAIEIAKINSAAAEVY